MTDRLLTPSRDIVSIDEHREQAETAKRRPTGKMGDFVTREEMMMAVGKASLALGQKMYDQASGELAENFDEQEARMIDLIQRRFAALERERMGRTFLGRCRRLVRWLRGDTVASPTLVPDPPKVAPALGTKEWAVAELRRRIATVEDGGDVTVPEGLTAEEAKAIANEYDAEVRAAAEEASKP